MNALTALVANDLKQRLRDKSVLIFGLLVPLALMTVLNLAFGGLGDDGPALKPVTLIAGVDDQGPLGDVVLESLVSSPALEVSVQRVAPGDVARTTLDGGSSLGIVIPRDFTESLTTGSAATLQLTRGSSPSLETDVLISVVKEIVKELHAASLTGAAGRIAGLSPAAASDIARSTAAALPLMALKEATAPTEQLPLRASLVAGQTGLFLLFTVGFGVVGLLVEKEQGTFARIRSVAVPPWTITASKAVVGFLLGVAASTVLLTSGMVFFGVAFGSPVVVGLLVISAAAAATSLTFIVVRLVRSAEQANVAQSIIAMVLGIAGGAFFPLQSTGFLATVLELNPVGAFIRGLGISAGGGGIGDVLGPLGVMWIFAAACTLLSRFIPDRSAAQ